MEPTSAGGELVLVVDDEPHIVALVAYHLAKAGYRVTTAGNGTDALALANRERPALVVLDLMLPGMSGFDVLRKLRARDHTRDVAVLMLTARRDEPDRIEGLSLGADDYLTKPFSPHELVARVRALLRRAARGASPATRTLAYGPIAVDAERHVVSSDGRDVTLTAKEFLLLEYLLQHRGRVLSRDVLLTDVWGYRYTGGTRTVDVHVRRLREKLPLLADALVTVKQFGYKLLDPAPSAP